jgi:hypothetical protein
VKPPRSRTRRTKKVNKGLATVAENLDSVRCPFTGEQVRFRWDHTTPDELLRERREALFPKPTNPRRRRRRERSRP